MRLIYHSAKAKMAARSQKILLMRPKHRNASCYGSNFQLNSLLPFKKCSRQQELSDYYELKSKRKCHWIQFIQLQQQAFWNTWSIVIWNIKERKIENGGIIVCSAILWFVITKWRPTLKPGSEIAEFKLPDYDRPNLPSLRFRFIIFV